MFLQVDEEMKSGAQLFAYLKQLLKLYTRQRDKAMMLSIVEEPVAVQLFRDLFTIFYEPLIRVYKSANVYNSVTDFSDFADDAIRVVERCQRQDVAADPNQTVQAFIDLCQRHEHNFYKFVHEVHIHDNGLFTQLMGWLEGILDFLRHGPKGGKLDMNALFQGAVDMSQISKEKAIPEIDLLIQWQEERKQWHHNKTRQKMAADGSKASEDSAPGSGTFRSSDFGLNEVSILTPNSIPISIKLTEVRTRWISRNSRSMTRTGRMTKTPTRMRWIPSARRDTVGRRSKTTSDVRLESRSSLRLKRCIS